MVWLQIAVSDNLKAGIAKACLCEPAANPTYAERAAHYATTKRGVPGASGPGLRAPADEVGFPPLQLNEALHTNDSTEPRAV
jgi:hypothetical protein